MKRRIRIFETLTILLGWVFVMTSCNDLADIVEGDELPIVECRTDAECFGADPECVKSALCIDSQCTVEFITKGTPSSEQPPGDCAHAECDGKGRIRNVPDTADAYDDENPCTLDICEGTSTIHKRQDSFACYSGPLETRGRGICKDGIQLCAANGVPMGVCQGEVLPQEETCLSPQDDDCDGLANEEGASCSCQPGEMVPCYTGPAGTVDNGICHGGTAVCQSHGLGFGPCLGEQHPAAEMCDMAGQDEDCDGQSNEEGADCTCGDGFVSPNIGETCDDGNGNDTDACRNDCVVQSCGDGIVQMGETCDDGNVSNTDACTTKCLVARCGDGYLQQGESCDDGPAQGAGVCPNACLRGAVKICAGRGHTCALLEDGRLKCWGANSDGRLGLGDSHNRGDGPDEMGDNLPTVDLGVGKFAIDISCGDDFTCALLFGGKVKCWGNNEYGQLGQGDTRNRGDAPNEIGDNLPPIDLGQPAIAITTGAGQAHACALLADNSVKCWGNNVGQLGTGDSRDHGATPGSMGSNLPAVNLGSGTYAVAIGAGERFTCALLNDGRVKCWGSNSYGQLGLGDMMDRGSTPGSLGENLPAVDLGTGKTAVAISVGKDHVCAILNDQSLKCWGYNYGYLGIPKWEHQGGHPGEMGDNLPTVDLGTGKVAVTVFHGQCAILNDGALKCWGGMASFMKMGDNLPAINLGAGKTATTVAMKLEHRCVIINGHRIKCFGYNDTGQLGLGDTESRGDDPWEQGDALPFVAP